MAGTVMLAYYFEYTDTFNVHVQGFFCYDNAYTKPYLGPEEASAIPPALLYAVVSGVPTLVVSSTYSLTRSQTHFIFFNADPSAQLWEMDACDSLIPVRFGVPSY